MKMYIGRYEHLLDHFTGIAIYGRLNKKDASWCHEQDLVFKKGHICVDVYFEKDEERGPGCIGVGV